MDLKTFGKNLNLGILHNLEIYASFQYTSAFGAGVQKSQNWSHCETLESNPILKWNDKALIHSNTQVLTILKSLKILTLLKVPGGGADHLAVYWSLFVNMLEEFLNVALHVWMLRIFYYFCMFLSYLCIKRNIFGHAEDPGFLIFEVLFTFCALFIFPLLLQ